MTNSPTEDAVLTKLRAFLISIVGAGVEVVQGLGNRVPSPADPYVAMTVIHQQRLATNQDAYADPAPTTGTRTVSESVRLDVQLDFFGPLAGTWAQIACMLLRDDYGCSALAPECQPLYADDARNVPFVTGEQEYMQRYMVTATLQWNPATVLPQQFADQLRVELVEMDERYPPT